MGNKKRNALKHGANATEVMLWSERYQDYEALRDGLHQEFTPSGSNEEYLVGTLFANATSEQQVEAVLASLSPDPR